MDLEQFGACNSVFNQCYVYYFYLPPEKNILKFDWIKQKCITRHLGMRETLKFSGSTLILCCGLLSSISAK